MLAKLKSTVTDLVGIAGAGLVSFGTWMIYPPAGFIVAGVFLIAGCVIASRPTKEK